MQHLGFAPQIPTLTPAEMRNQSTLDRLTTFLRSLVLIPGEGINVRRDGSSGTVVEAASQSSIELSNDRRISLGMSGANFTVTCPALIIFYIYPCHQSNLVTPVLVPAKTFSFTSAYPSYVGIKENDYGGASWIHDSANGTDATTTDQYINFGDFLTVAKCYAKASSVLYDIPLYVTSIRQNFSFFYTKSSGALSIITGAVNNAQWYKGAAGAFAGNASATFKFTARTLTAGQDLTLYYELPENWYELYASARTFGTIPLKISTEAQAGYIYANAGSVKTNANNDLIYVVGPALFPPWIPFYSSDVAGQYVKTVNFGASTVTYGTVTGKKGIIQGAS